MEVKEKKITKNGNCCYPFEDKYHQIYLRNNFNLKKDTSTIRIKFLKRNERILQKLKNKR